MFLNEADKGSVGTLINDTLRAYDDHYKHGHFEFDIKVDL